MIAADSGWRSLAVKAVALYALCLLAAALTEWLSTLPGTGLSLWLPAGFLLAALTVSKSRDWPWWMAAAASAELTGNIFWYGHEAPPAMLFAAGNILAATTGALIIRRLIPHRYIFASIKSTAIFLGVAALVVPIISATIGSMALAWSYGNAPFAAWSRIMLGDATGAVVAAPLAMLLFGGAAAPLHFTRPRWVELAVLTLVFLGLASISLGGLVPFAFLMIPPLLWAALRFRAVGAIISSSALMLSTALFTVAKVSPFALHSVYAGYSHAGLQLFLLVATATALLMGAMAEEMRLAMKRLFLANQTLEDRVIERSESLALSEAKAHKTASLLSAIGDASPDLIFAKDLESRLTYANRATLNALGASSSAEVLGETADTFYSDRDEHDSVLRNDAHVVATGETLICEEPVTAPDGSTRIFRSTKAPIFDSEGQLTGIAGVSVDITDIRKSEARERMLVREVEHRSRNLLAVVQGLVHLTSAETLKDFKAALANRIRALARTNGAIAAADWRGAGLRQILTDELGPYDDAQNRRIILTGDDVFFDPGTAQSLTLVLHELSTNAAKYGALSSAKGRLDVSWISDSNPSGHIIVTLHWRESGGPKVAPPTRKGFGTDVIETFALERPGGKVDYHWHPEGLHVELRIPLLRQDHPLPSANDDRWFAIDAA